MKPIRVFMLLSVAMLPAAPARAGLIFGQLNYGSVTALTDRTGTPLPLNGAGFSAHAGANVGGTFVLNGNGRWILMGGTSDVEHVPVQTGAAATTFPADYISVVANPRTYAPVPPLGIRYATIPKDIDGEANGAMARVNMGGTLAQARVLVSFTSGPAGRYNFNPSMSSVSIERGMGAPRGNAANTIIDPWTTSTSVQQGDVLHGSISLSASDFKVTINGEPNGLLMGSITVGSNFPTTSVPGSSAPGLDSQGLPIVLQIALDFSPGHLLNPSVLVSEDPSYTFSNPDTNLPINPSDLSAFLANRIDSVLQLDLTDDPTGNTVDLSSDVTLLDWSGTAVVDSSSIVSIDDVQATLAQTDFVPEPGSLVLAAIAATVLTVLMRRRGLLERVVGSGTRDEHPTP